MTSPLPTAAVPAALPGAAPKPATAPSAVPVTGPAADAPGPTAPAFAADLARLIANLAAGSVATDGAGEDEALPANAAPRADEAPLALDAIAALCMQIGLASEPRRALPDTAQGLGDRVSMLASSGAPPLAAPGLLVKAAEALAAGVADLPLPPEMALPAEATSSTSPAFSLAAPLAERSAAPAIAPTVIDLRLPQAPQRIAETLVWRVAEGGGGEVRIHLSPEHLGPLDVHLKLDGDKVAVRFDAADAGVRDVVQTSLPSLATLLSARGLQLDQAQVFSQGRGQQQMAQAHAQPDGQGGGDSDSDAPVAALRVSARRGLVDDYV